MLAGMNADPMSVNFIAFLLKIVSRGVNDDELGVEDFQRLDIMLEHYLALSERRFTPAQENALDSILINAFKAAREQQLTSVSLFDYLNERFNYAHHVLTEQPTPEQSRVCRQ